MKSCIVIIATIFCIAAIAQEKATDITLLDGKVLKNARISRVDPDGLRVVHDEGMTKIPMENLPPALKEKYSFDTGKADMFRDKQRQAQEKAAEEHKRQVAEEQRKIHEAAEKSRNTPRLTTSNSVKDYWIRSLPKPEGISDHQYGAKIKFSENMTKLITSGQVDLEAEKTALLWNQSEYQRVGQDQKAKDLVTQIEGVQDAINKREQRRQEAEIAQMQAQLEAAKIASMQELGNTLNNIAFQLMNGVTVRWVY